MQYSCNPIKLSIISITIAITSMTCIRASILKQCSSFPSPSPSRLSHALQLRSYNNVLHFNHHRLHVYHMHYSSNPITMSINIAITSITCMTASILKQCLSPSSPSPSRLSHKLQFQSYNNVHQFYHHRHHVYHMHYNFTPITMSITIAIRSITCITTSIL